MTPIVWTYLAYLAISIPLTVWVARTRACEMVSENRWSLSAWFAGLGDEALGAELAGRRVGPCKDDCRCG